MKQLLKINLITLSILIIQGCYTQFATTKAIYVKQPEKSYLTEETLITTNIELDSLLVDSSENDIVIKEYHYWAYDPLFGFDPYYDNTNLYIHIYPSRPYRWDPWFYGYRDPFWMHDYGYWNYYDPYPWDYGWYGYYRPHYSYWHRPYHHHYNNWHWYAGHNDDPPLKKRDWRRRGPDSSSDTNVRNPGTRAPAGSDDQFAAVGTDNNLRIRKRNDSQNIRPAIYSDNGSPTINRRGAKRDKPLTLDTRKDFKSRTTRELIKLISGRTDAGDQKSSRTIIRSRSKDSSSDSKGSARSNRSSDSKSKKHSASSSRSKKTSNSSKSNRSRSNSKKASSSKRSRR